MPGSFPFFVSAMGSSVVPPSGYASRMSLTTSKLQPRNSARKMGSPAKMSSATSRGDAAKSVTSGGSAARWSA